VFVIFSPRCRTVKTDAVKWAVGRQSSDGRAKLQKLIEKERNISVSYNNRLVPGYCQDAAQDRAGPTRGSLIAAAKPA